MHGKVVEIFSIINNEGAKPLCHMVYLGMHSNVMLRFMVQALQDPQLCSSTDQNVLRDALTM
jgi:hypothetical protein